MDNEAYLDKPFVAYFTPDLAAILSSELMLYNLKTIRTMIADSHKFPEELVRFTFVEAEGQTTLHYSDLQPLVEAELARRLEVFSAESGCNDDYTDWSEEASAQFEAMFSEGLS